VSYLSKLYPTLSDNIGASSMILENNSLLSILSSGYLFTVKNFEIMCNASIHGLNYRCCIRWFKMFLIIGSNVDLYAFNP
jgi:hypothetical protein